MSTATETPIDPAELAGEWTIDPAHSRLGFIARHAMVTSVRGSFDTFEGGAHIDPANLAATKLTATISVGSVTTGQAQRDEHLRTGDFFDAAAHPEMTFVSTKVEAKDAETFLVTGDFTIKGITKPVTIEWTFNGLARDPFGNLRAGFEGTASISRKEWGLTYNASLETGGVLVGDKVKLEFDISALKAAA